MAKNTKKMSLTTIRNKILASNKLNQKCNLFTYEVNSVLIPIPKKILISYQNFHVPPPAQLKNFHHKFVLKIHLSGISKGYVENQKYTFKKGDAFLIFPFQVHYITEVTRDSISDGQIRLLANFDLTDDEQCLLQPLRGKILRLDDEDIALIGRIMEYLGNNSTQAQRETVFAMSSLLMRFLEKDVQGTVTPHLDETPSKIGKVFHEMYMEYLKNPSIKSIAEKLGYSENGLRQFFLRETGQLPGRFMQNLRMRKAQDLLLHTQLSIHQIASVCGFSDQYNFCRAFKKIFQCSPKKYKKLHG